MIVPDEARTLLANMRGSFGIAGYLDAIWSARDHNAAAVKSAGKWPFVRACDRPTEAKVDVMRLPVKLRLSP